MFPGVGTLVNVVAVLLGASLGVALGHRLPQRTRDVVTDGLGLVTLVIALLSAYAVTDDVLVDWYKSVWEHGWRLRNFHRTGNWLIMEMNGLAQIGILYPQFRDAPAWKAYAYARLVDELEAQVYPDGFQVELSTGYRRRKKVHQFTDGLTAAIAAYG